MDPEIRIRRLMTAPALSIDVEDRPSSVLKRLAGHPGHHLPVVRDGKLVGMLGDTDLRKLDAVLPRKGAAADCFLDSHVSIEQLMSPPTVTAGPDDPVGAVARRMIEAGVHAAPVVDTHGLLVGILTTTDIIEAALQDSRSGSPAAHVGQTLPDDEHRRALQAVLLAADRYLRAGQDERLHAGLLNAVEKAKRMLGEATGAHPVMLRY